MYKIVKIKSKQCFFAKNFQKKVVFGHFGLLLREEIKLPNHKFFHKYIIMFKIDLFNSVV